MSEKTKPLDWVDKGFYSILIILAGGLFVWLAVPGPDIKVISPNVEMIELIPEIMDSVVHIQCPSWQGSGFVVSKHLIQTARHVVEGCDSFIITFDDGTKVNATKSISAKENDVAFIYIEEEIQAPIAKLKSIHDCVLGQQILVIGSSYGIINFNTVSTGIISGLDRNWNDINPNTGQEYGWEWGFTIDASGAPGNSGCPIFTLDGEVIGVLVGGYDSTHIFCMPSDLVKDDLEKIESMFELSEKYKFEEVVNYVDNYYEDY